MQVKSTLLAYSLIVFLESIPYSSASPIIRSRQLPNFFSTVSDGSGSTRNDLVDGTCKPVTVIFARGTGEAGNVGTVTGPPMFDALTEAFGAENVAVQGVDYAASVAGFVGDPAGNAEMTRLVELAATNCSGTNVVLSGYSQGAMLVHNSAADYSATAIDAIKAVVLFGDPFHTSSPSVDNILDDKLKVFCAAGDSVCLGTAIITPAHLSYGQDAGAAAQFVQSKITL